MNRNKCIFLALLIAAAFPIGALAYGCVHYFMLMYQMNHVNDRGPKEDRYEWLFTGLFLATAFALVVYTFAWNRFFRTQWNAYQSVGNAAVQTDIGPTSMIPPMSELGQGVTEVEL